MSSILRFLAPLVALAVSACASTAPKSQDAASMIAAAAALDKAYLAAVNAGDVDGTMALYWNSPDVVTIGVAGTPLRGYQAVRDYYSQAYKGMPGARYELTSMNNIVHGGVVLGWGTWRATIPAQGGPPTIIEGRYTDAKSLKDGKWVYIMDHGSSLPAPPPPAAAVKQ